MRPDGDQYAPVFRLQVWHLAVAGLGLLAAPAHAVGAAPVQAGLAGLLVAVLIVLLGARRARRRPTRA